MREWLFALRTKRGLTQKYVAERAGISQPSYFNIEHGSRGVSVKTAKAIASVLGIDWTRFYEDGEGEENAK